MEAHNCHGKTKTLTEKTKYPTAKLKTSRQNQILHSKSKIALVLPWVFAFAVKYLVFAVKYLVLPWSIWFFLWSIWFCREVFVFAVRFSVLPWGILFLPWGFWFCREVFCFCHEVFGFAVTVLGHRTFYLLGMWTQGFQIRSTRSVLYRLSYETWREQVLGN